jgi:hypothetical protein
MSVNLSRIQRQQVVSESDYLMVPQDNIAADVEKEELLRLKSTDQKISHRIFIWVPVLIRLINLESSSDCPE